MDGKLEKICSFLNSMGVETVENDPLLGYVAAQTQEAIRNAINQPQIPEGLSWCFVYRAAGQYLRLKKDSGRLDVGWLDLDAPEKQIQEGDTSVTFAVEASLSPEQRLEQLIGFLQRAGEDQFARYRRLLW